MTTLQEEFPGAYKDVNEVVKVNDAADISNRSYHRLKRIERYRLSKVKSRSSGRQSEMSSYERIEFKHVILTLKVR